MALSPESCSTWSEVFDFSFARFLTTKLGEDELQRSYVLPTSSYAHS